MAQIAKKAFIHVIIFCLILTPILTGCGSPSETGGTITEENLTAGKTDGVSVTFSEFDIDTETDVTISNVEITEFANNPDISVNAVDITIPEKEEFNSLIKITIPYDAKMIESGGNPTEQVEAKYKNPETNEWEPVVFEVDTENKVAIITTDHLSTYAVFTYSREYTRYSKIRVNPAAYINLMFGDNKIYEKVFPDLLGNNGNPTDVTLEEGFNIANEALGIAGNGLTFITEALYSTKVLGDFGNLFTGLGVAGAVFQAAYDWKNWEKDDGLSFKTNITKNIGYLYVSIMGKSAAKLASVGVFAIDYSLNKFGTEAWAGRNELYKKAYNAYYTDMYPGRKLPRKLYQLINDAYLKTRDSGGDFDLTAETKRIVMEFAGEFWADESNLPIYLQDAGIKFTGLGGFNKDTITETTNSYYLELMQTTMQPIFKSLSDKIVYDLQRDYLRKLYKIQNEMNRKVTVNIFETKENDDTPYKYAEHQLRFAPLDESTDKANWTGKLKKDATATTYFTVIGFLQSGAPTKLEIYEPDADIETTEPIEVIDFSYSLDIDELNIDLGSKPPTLDDLVGTWDNQKNLFTLLEADADWSAIKNSIVSESEKAVDEMKEEYGCDPEMQITPESIDQMESSLEGMIGNTQYVIFSIEKISETTGKLTFVSFPDSTEGECDSVTGLSFNFNYKDGKMTVDYNSFFNYMRQKNQEEMSFEKFPFRNGNGSFKAEWVGGKKTIIIDGNIDYSIRDTSAEIPFDMYINYGLHGEK